MYINPIMSIEQNLLRPDLLSKSLQVPSFRFWSRVMRSNRSEEVDTSRWTIPVIGTGFARLRKICWGKTEWCNSTRRSCPTNWSFPSRFWTQNTVRHGSPSENMTNVFEALGSVHVLSFCLVLISVAVYLFFNLENWALKSPAFVQTWLELGTRLSVIWRTHACSIHP